MPATSGERQIGNQLSDIAPNHVSRYEWATLELQLRLPAGSRVLDAACGVGYGSWLLANAGFIVDCFDYSTEAENYQRKFHHENIQFRRDDIMNIQGRGEEYNAVVSLETIEHVASEEWIIDVGRMTDIMVGTVPNQDVVPFDAEKYPWHHRHYTKNEVIELMHDWEIESWATQIAKWEDHEMRPGDHGMTLGWVATK